MIGGRGEDCGRLRGSARTKPPPSFLACRKRRASRCRRQVSASTGIFTAGEKRVMYVYGSSKVGALRVLQEEQRQATGEQGRHDPVRGGPTPLPLARRRLEKIENLESFVPSSLQPPLPKLAKVKHTLDRDKTYFVATQARPDDVAFAHRPRAAARGSSCSRMDSIGPHAEISASSFTACLHWRGERLVSLGSLDSGCGGGPVVNAEAFLSAGD